MKQNLKRIINLILLIIVAVVAFLFVKSIPDFLIGKANTTMSKVKNSEVLELKPSTLLFSSKDISYPGGYVYVSAVGTQVYCAQKGGHIGNEGITYEELEKYIEDHKDDTKDCGCALPKQKTSILYYKEDYKRVATVEEAYILTYPTPGYNDWSPEKQQAVWASTLSNNLKAPSSSAESQAIVNSAKDFKEFTENIKNNNGEIFKQDLTKQEEIKRYALYGTQEYIIGPFKMDYVNGEYDTSFGGITDMYIEGKNSSRIEIETFVVNNVTEQYIPNYFNPDGVGYTDNLEQKYPEPGEEFYVRYYATKDEQLEKLHVDFEWMEAEAEVTYYKGYKYKSKFECSHSDHCDGHQGSHDIYCPPNCSDDHTSYCGGCCYDCKITGTKIEEFEAGSQTLLSATGKRWKKSQSIEITIPPIPEKDDDDNDGDDDEEIVIPPPPSENLQIILAGHVWEDEDSGKESLPNGEKDDNENYKGGVEVILHYSDGSVVNRDAEGRILQNPTVTDKNGYYEFNGLNAQKKYYVEFVYDGQIYQATQYNTSLTNAQRLKGKITNATEIASERETFNNNFAQINSAPGNYTVRRSLYYSVGSTNSAYIVDKTSNETPYGIKEIYDYVIEQAISTKSYSKAYANALNKFGNNNATKSKLQFIEDCRISSYTGYDTSRVVYPIWDNFVEDYTGKTILGVYYYPLYPTHLRIDFGLNKRETFDLALRKDVEKATVEINGKVHTYTYDTRGNIDEVDAGAWDINIRLADSYYNTKYSREVFGSDYQYKASNYDNAAEYGKTKEDELNVYVTYKLTVRNQSQSILGEVMEIVDYYDEDYEYVNERSYIEIKYGNNKGQHSINVYNDSRYGSGNETQIPGYNALYVRGLEGMKLTSGQTAYVYLTFRIKKDNINGEDWIRLDEQVESATAIGVGKENIAEINGFKTYYRDGTQIPNVGEVSGQDKVAGLFDKDSVPGNLNPNDVPKDGNINYNNFEDDTDKAPNIRLILYRENGELVCRTIDGIVWEDERTEVNNDQKTTVADGIKQDKENAINGVTVQLVELMDNGTEYVWKTFSSGQNYINGNDVYTPIINVTGPSGNALIKADKDTTEGKYIFKSYMAGNYVVRFIYGDTVKTVLPNTSTEVTNLFGQNGQNAKSYNGQDYKSTTYQEGVTPYSTYANSNSPKSYIYDIAASDARADISDAKDIMTDDNINKPYYRQNATLNSREDVIDYSDNDVMNYIAEVLAAHEKLPLNSSELSTKLQELMQRTQMTAETGTINIEVEYNRNGTGSQIENNNTTYKIQNLSLGLEERPKAQLTINKEVTNVKVVLADGATLFDATQKATNVMWREHRGHEFKYSDYKLSEDPMATVRRKNSYDLVYGLIQLSMDEELMHGATIKISYKITVRNVGEVDYKDNEFYYTGNVSDKSTIVETSPNQIIDYVANNLQFYAVDNSSWEVISKDELLSGPVNVKLANAIEKYNTVITTNNRANIVNSQLVPEIYGSGTSSVSDTLVLTQLITSENETDDLTYRNIVEIVKTSNDVGRRNAYSVVGNQNPTKDVTEVDTDVAEIVKILPPYGNGGIYYIIGTIVILSSAILIAGIIFIKKKVLR